MLKQTTTFLIPFLLSTTMYAQVDYCSELDKAIDAVADNFSSYTNFQYDTQGGAKAYLSDFSFVAGQSGYIYKESNGTERYFYQLISENSADYTSIYESIEHCLANETDRWMKLDATNGSAVLFTCDKTGGNIKLVSGNAGVSIEIERDEKMNQAVLSDHFCNDLQQLASTCNYDFEGVRTTNLGPSMFGTNYESGIQLNQRNLSGGSIEIAMDLFDKNVKDNSYIETFSGHDISFEDLLQAVEACLDGQGGWKKSESKFKEGYEFYKDHVTISITTGKIFESDEVASHVISVNSD